MIGWIARQVTGAAGPYIIGAAGAVMLGAVGFGAFQTWRVNDLSSDLTEARQNATDWRRKSGEWERAFRESERRRGIERGNAVGAATEAAKACNARVAEARRSAAAIKSIVTKEPARDPKGCPVRELVPADSLRNALQPPAR